MVGGESMAAGSNLAVRGPLANTEDDKFGRPQRGDADQANEPAIIEIVLRHRRTVALDEVGLFRLVTQEGAHLPFVQEEVFDGAPDIGPELLAIGFEDGPLRSLVDRSFEV